MSRYMERTKSEIKLLQTNYVALQDNAIKRQLEIYCRTIWKQRCFKNDDFKIGVILML